MQTVVKMTVNEDGELLPYGGVWHAGSSEAGSNVLLCSGEVYDEEGQVDAEGCAKGITKSVARGGITCPGCLDKIRSIKAIKL